VLHSPSGRQDVDAEECREEVQQMWQRAVATPSGPPPRSFQRRFPCSLLIVSFWLAAGRLHPQRRARPSRVPDRGADPRTGRSSLVADTAAQSARTTAQDAAACPRQSAHRGDQNIPRYLSLAAFNRPPYCRDDGLPQCNRRGASSFATVPSAGNLWLATLYANCQAASQTPSYSQLERPAVVSWTALRAIAGKSDP
jgi:hypothetical protein